jgi:hypothetical protein
MEVGLDIAQATGAATAHVRIIVGVGQIQITIENERKRET